MQFGGKYKESLNIRKKRNAAPCVLSTGENSGLDGSDGLGLIYIPLKG